MLLGAARPDIAALRQSVTDLSASATEHNTQLAHRRARRYWIVFASAYPDLAADPCDVAHLQLFISFLVHNNKTHSNIVQILGGVGASTCDSRWAATRSHPAITSLLAGIHRTQQEHNHLSRGPPRRSDIITPDTLLTILDRVDPMAPDALLFTTVALAAFDRLFRLCELLEPNPRRDGATPHNRGRKRILFSSLTHSADGDASFYLPATKNDATGRGSLVTFLRRTPATALCAASALHHFGTIRSMPEYGASPYLFAMTDGRLPTMGWFLRWLHRVTGIDFGSKAFRQGGATWLAEQGYTAEQIQHRGRWSSRAWQRYVQVDAYLAAVLQRQADVAAARSHPASLHLFASSDDSPSVHRG